jgi:hypothetical protein
MIHSKIVVAVTRLLTSACPRPSALLRHWLEAVLIHRLADLDDAALLEELGRLLRLRQFADVVPSLRVVRCPLEYG